MAAATQANLAPVTSIDFKDKPVTRHSFSIGLLSLLFVLCGYYLVYPAEDAVILFEYSRTLAESGQISYGNSATPIEGATDFLWMMGIAAFSWLGMDEFLASLIVSALCLCALVSILARYTNYWVAFAAVLFTPFVYSSLLGFSSITFALCYVAVLHFFYSGQRDKMYILLLVLCLVRPDGVVWGMPIVLLDLFSGRFVEKLKTAMIYLVIPGMAYFVARALYFGELLPLPFYVKAGGERDWLWFIYTSYKYVRVVAIPLVVALLLAGKRRELFIILVPILFYTSMHLYQNIGNRFMAPMFFGGFILLSGAKLRFHLVYLLLAVVMLTKQTSNVLRDAARSTSENIFTVSKDLHGINGKMLITEAGRLTYYSDWQADDSWGLNTPKFAKSLIQPEDVKAGNYDLVVAHCKLKYLREPIAVQTVREWDNQCKNMILGFGDDFDLHLVPFWMENGNWVYEKMKAKYPEKYLRYDIYAIAKTSPRYKDIQAVIFKNGGILYTPELKIKRDRVYLQ